MMIDKKNGIIRYKIKFYGLIMGAFIGLAFIFSTIDHHIVYISNILIGILTAFIFPWLISNIFVFIVNKKILVKMENNEFVKALKDSKILEYQFKEVFTEDGTFFDRTKLEKVTFELDNGNKIKIYAGFYSGMFGEQDYAQVIYINSNEIEKVSENIITADVLVYFLHKIILPKIMNLENQKNIKELDQKNELIQKSKEASEIELNKLLKNSDYKTLSNEEIQELQELHELESQNMELNNMVK